MTYNVIQSIEGLACRLEKARTLVEEGKVRPIINKEDAFIVESSSGVGYYLVDKDTGCTCPDACTRRELHRGLCKHRLAILVYLEAQGTVTEAKAA